MSVFFVMIFLCVGAQENDEVLVASIPMRNISLRYQSYETSECMMIPLEKRVHMVMFETFVSSLIVGLFLKIEGAMKRLNTTKLTSKNLRKTKKQKQTNTRSILSHNGTSIMPLKQMLSFFRPFTHVTNINVTIAKTNFRD